MRLTRLLPSIIALALLAPGLCHAQTSKPISLQPSATLPLSGSELILLEQIVNGKWATRQTTVNAFFTGTVTAPMLAPGAAALNLGSGGVSSSMLASGAAAANLGSAGAPALTTSQTASGTITSSPNNCPALSINCIFIGSDTANVSGGVSQGQALSVFHQYGGAGTGGGRNSFSIWSVLTAPTDASNTNRNYVAAQAYFKAMSSDGGTDTGAGALGAGFGINPYCILANGATNFLECTGGEVNVAIRTGASARIKAGWSIAALSDDAVQGATYDAALMVSSQTGAVGWANGIMFSASNGQFPISSTGTILKTTGATFANGIDFSSNTITGNAFQSPGFYVTGIGVVYVGQQLQLNGGALINWQNKSQFSSPVNGNLLATNMTGNGFGLLQLGGTSASFPALGVSGSALNARLADNSADTGIIALAYSASGVSSATAPGIIMSACGANCGLFAPAANQMALSVGGVNILDYGIYNATRLTAHVRLEMANNIISNVGQLTMAAGGFAANGAVSTSLGSVAPAAAHATPQEWLQVTDSSGTVRYIPAF